MQGRINLCFELENPRQRMVYEYLRGRGRVKTQIVVDTIMASIEKAPTRVAGIETRPPADMMAELKDIIAAEVANQLSRGEAEATAAIDNNTRTEQSVQGETDITDADFEALAAFKALGLGT